MPCADTHDISASADMPNYDEYSSLWEGNSPNAAHAYERMKAAGQAPDNSWLERLFGGAKQGITSQPLPPMNPTDEGRFPPSPFGGPAAPPAPKPASKISSAADIAKRISGMIRAANEPPPVSPADFGLPPSEYMSPQGGDPLAMAMSQIPNAEEPPPPRVPIDMREESSPSPFTSASLSGLPASVKQAVAKLLGGGNTFGGNRFGGQRFGGNEYGGHQFGGGRFGASAGPGETGGEPMMEAPSTAYGGNRFGGNRFGGNTYGGNEYGGRRFGASAGSGTEQGVARPDPTMTGEQMWRNLQRRWASPFEAGGEVPGFMRGGYPELRTAPIRHQFDSGGANYVDGDSDGRADNVDARLSSGEYVMTAEDVALLGNGNSKAGAKKLDAFRINLRKHKGAALAKGKISPNAKKNPAEYLVGDPISDGVRRLGKGK
jgi:hypothetical protein